MDQCLLKIKIQSFEKSTYMDVNVLCIHKYADMLNKELQFGMLISAIWSLPYTNHIKSKNRYAYEYI